MYVAWSILTLVVMAVVAAMQRLSNPLPYPDEAGLSADSLRGSEHMIRPDLIGSEAKNPYTGGSVGRDPLTYHEAHALMQTGVEVNRDHLQTDPDDLPPIVRGPDAAPPATVPPQTVPTPLPQPGTPATTTVPDGTRVGPDGAPMTPDRSGVVAPADAPVETPNDAHTEYETARATTAQHPAVLPTDPPPPVTD